MRAKCLDQPIAHCKSTVSSIAHITKRVLYQLFPSFPSVPEIAIEYLGQFVAS
jgi:hypothetical protein